MSAIEKYLTAAAMDALRGMIAETGGNEVFVVGEADETGRVTEVRALARGNIDSVPAVMQALSPGQVVIHNHPSGALEASPEDIEFTKTFRSACDLVGLELLDHIIVTDDGFTSMRERGLI